MSWIKIESHLRTKPEIIDIADKLGIKDTHAQGVCIAFWQWMDGITTNGTAKARRSMIDRIVNEPGFAAAMETVGWLSIDDTAGTITIPNWDRHCGEMAKDRALNSRRQKRFRDKAAGDNVTAGSDDSNATVTQDRYATVTKVTQGPLPEKSRIDESREKEKTSSSPTPSSVGGGDAFTVPMVPPSQVPEAQRVYIPPKPPTAPKPFVDPETLSTVGRQRPEEVYCCQLLANGRIAADTAPFRAFWAKYPKKMKREQAADAWNVLFADGTESREIRYQSMMRYLEQELPKLSKDNAQFAPQPADWLDSRGWIAIEEAAKAKAKAEAAKANAPKLSPEEIERIRKEREDQRRRDEEDEQLRRDQIAELSKKFRETLAI